VLRSFTVEETVLFFRGLGVPLHEEPGGKLFPDSNRSRDVLGALLREVDAYGATLLAGHRVHAINRGGRGFTISTSHGALEASRVVIATGGQSLPKSGSDGAGYGFAERLGHSLVETTPGLVPLTMSGDSHFHAQLSGVSHAAEIAVWVDGRIATRLTGSLLWTHFGISGPLALDASRHWLRAQIEGRHGAMFLNAYPGWTFDDFDRHLTVMARTRSRTSIENALAGASGAVRGLPGSLVRAVLLELRIDGETKLSQLTREARRLLGRAMTERPLPVTGSRGYNYAEVTAGGVALTEIDPSTMESRVCRGLYLVGEVLDVDGRIGGFNFQWAWSSARACARGLSGRADL
jgi:hypothetical protein